MSVTPMTNTVPIRRPELVDYVVISPDGRCLVISEQLFDALALFIGERRQYHAGQAEIQFRNGGVAGVEFKAKLK